MTPQFRQSDLLVRFTVTHDNPKESENVDFLVEGACNVGVEGAPIEDYRASGIQFEVLALPELADALDQLEGFTEAQRRDFYDQLQIAARGIAEHIAEDAS